MGSLCTKDQLQIDEGESYSWINSQGSNHMGSGRSSLNTKDMKNAAMSNGGESYYSVDRNNLNSTRLADYYSIVLNPNNKGKDAPPKSMMQITMNKMSRKAQSIIQKFYGRDKISENQHIVQNQIFGPVFYDNGASYKGQYKLGQKSGYGEMVFSDGSVYRGLWKKDQKSGYGVLALTDGDYYMGNFEMDKANGFGIKKSFFFVDFYFRCL